MTGGENGGLVPVAESLLERMVEGLIDRFDLDKETREAAAIALMIALEAKYPHRGAVLGGIIAERLGLINLPRSSTQPATMPSGTTVPAHP